MIIYPSHISRKPKDNSFGSRFGPYPHRRNLECPYRLRKFRQAYVRTAAVRRIGRHSRRTCRGIRSHAGIVQTSRISEQDWIACNVGVGVQSTSQADWVALLIASQPRIEVSEVIVVSRRLYVIGLPWESQRKVEDTEPTWILIGHVVSKWFLLSPAPHRDTPRVSDQSWRVEMIRVDEIVP